MTIPSRGTIGGANYLALRALARRTGRNTAEILQLFALEGFVARLSRSSHRDRLVLKGGVLLAAFDARRPTRDVDLLALRTDNDAALVSELVVAIAREPIEDGLLFDPARVEAEVIRDGEAYPGVRVTLRTMLASAQLTFHVDVNVGDPMWPGPEEVLVPRLLGADPVAVWGYPLVMVLAEKVVTMIQRGTANTRWRDFADVLTIGRRHAVAGVQLQRAISEVAAFRHATPVPLVSGLRGFDAAARARWAAWSSIWRTICRSTTLTFRSSDDQGVLSGFVDLMPASARCISWAGRAVRSPGGTGSALIGTC